MKYLEKIFDLKPIPAFLAWGVVTFLMTSGLFSLLIVFPGAVRPNMDIGVKTVLGIGGIFGVLMGLLFSFATATNRRSQAFWDRAKEVEKRLDDAKTSQDLDTIFNEEFSSDNGKLKGLCIPGPHHNQEIIRLYTVYVTKYKYLPEK
jgi:hypothetical protein